MPQRPRRKTIRLLANWLELRQPTVIARVFHDADIARDHSVQPPGVTGTGLMVHQYVQSLDLTSDPDLVKLLRVFAHALKEQETSEANQFYGAFSGIFGPKQHEPTMREFSEHLEMDGNLAAVRELMEGSAAPPLLDGVISASEPFDAGYLGQQIRRILDSVDSDPALAIGTAKELVETACKTILNARGADVDSRWTFGRLVKETRRQLQLTPDTASYEKEASDAVERILGGLGSLVQGLAELRNLHGTGHGPAGNTTGLAPRHARLAAGCAAALAAFLFETQQETHDGRD